MNTEFSGSGVPDPGSSDCCSLLFGTSYRGVQGMSPNCTTLLVFHNFTIRLVCRVYKKSILCLVYVNHIFKAEICAS